MIERKLLKCQLDNMMAYASNLGDRIRLERVRQEAGEREKAELDRKLQAEEAAYQQRQALVGLTVVEAGRCDSCPSEPTNCKKLQLADGSYICLVDNRKNRAEPESANTQDLTGGGPTPIL